ncbi:MAG: hypothetical protein KJ799_10220 [Bacteroidetes bacterium]|nr:hypothetical protein [Bacteroidota bacterium]MBU1677924.1 hypothetical protein [Bacteroidota bacterium]MBU2507083.1 hypothetical protein [Bacteroidota bacterium]
MAKVINYNFSLNACGDNTRNPLACVHTSLIFDSSKLANRIGAYFRLYINDHFNLFGYTAGEKDERKESFNYDKSGLPRKFKKGKGDSLYQLKLSFGKAEDNYIAQDIIYKEEKYLKQIRNDNLPSLLQLIIENYINNKNDDETNISEFHKRIGVKGIIDLLKADEELSHLLEKTCNSYLA